MVVWLLLVWRFQDWHQFRFRELLEHWAVGYLLWDFSASGIMAALAINQSSVGVDDDFFGQLCYACNSIISYAQLFIKMGQIDCSTILFILFWSDSKFKLFFIFRYRYTRAQFYWDIFHRKYIPLDVIVLSFIWSPSITQAVTQAYGRGAF